MDRMKEIGELISTQDNRATACPIFIVQEKVRHYGYDPDYYDDYVWVDILCDYEEAFEDEAQKLDKLINVPENWQKAHYVDRWEFVTACFTEKGCKDFIARDGHNHKELRVYAAGSYRNQEFQDVRNFLKGLADE